LLHWPEKSSTIRDDPNRIASAQTARTRQRKSKSDYREARTGGRRATEKESGTTFLGHTKKRGTRGSGGKTEWEKAFWSIEGETGNVIDVLAGASKNARGKAIIKTQITRWWKVKRDEEVPLPGALEGEAIKKRMVWRPGGTEEKPAGMSVWINKRLAKGVRFI